jgi:hypothetical protein
MANINVSSPSSFVQLQITSDSTIVDTTSTSATFLKWTSTVTTNVITVPALTDITVTNSNGTFRWVQLDSTSRSVVTTPATNSLNFNIVLDPTSFFTGAGSTNGLFDLSNNKTKVYFKFLWTKDSTSAPKAVYGQGYLAGLAPKVNPDQPVWITPLIVEVDGNYQNYAV